LLDESTDSDQSSSSTSPNRPSTRPGRYVRPRSAGRSNGVAEAAGVARFDVGQHHLPPPSAGRGRGQLIPPPSAAVIANIGTNTATNGYSRSLKEIGLSLVGNSHSGTGTASGGKGVGVGRGLANLPPFSSAAAANAPTTTTAYKRSAVVLSSMATV
jgi:hypothetical protein